ncbi:hypothetical protein HPB48_008540 [Haemaphysalis longicornis]|uniref:Uncharacterized protein n=1 Tax=Haemaphysalis longicornis TaxID=44386 RepID=A0A9J6GJQ8_HAELO|nr:hypothetical protein HPB48_008540 [Haemaphysalis longicornis]
MRGEAGVRGGKLLLLRAMGDPTAQPTCFSASLLLRGFDLDIERDSLLRDPVVDGDLVTLLLLSLLVFERFRCSPVLPAAGLLLRGPLGGVSD